MDVVKLLKEIPWCTEPWEAPQVSEEARQLLRECCAALPSEPDVDLRDVIENSKQFPVPFPIDTVRLEKLQAKCPLERLKRNVESTYPLVHERVLVIMANFILFKRQHGSDIEKQFYKNMTIPQLIDRILKKRAVSFMKAKDHYKLLSGEKGVDGWDAVGTKRQTPPLILENCLSYDEMKISALVNVSGYTECINDGSRNNAGLVREDGVENEAVIIGVIGPRFKRRKRMEYEDIIVNEDQNYEQNGYGCGETECFDVAIRAWRKMWGEFYQIPLYTDEELNARVKVPASSAARVLSESWVRARGGALHNTAYTRRLRLTADCALADAEQRATQRGAYAYVNIIGAGLGVWKFSNHQLDVYLLTFLDRINFFLQHGMLNHVSDVNLAFIQPDKNVADLFQNDNKSGDVESPKKIFFECVIHPRGGINVQLENRPPSSKLSGEHEGKLLILTYPWDSNAHPGNEFWLGKLTTSGDPAAACSTQVSELHNAHINPVVCGNNTRVATVNGIIPLAQHCAEAYKSE